jgi:hypothetical protein
MLQKYGDHLEKVKKQRDYYRDQCQESKENFTKLSQNQRMRGKFIYLLQENFTTKTCTCHCEDMMQLKYMYSNQIVQLCTM